MANRSPSNRKYPSIHDANSVIPDTTTLYLINEIQKLPDFPATTYLKDQFLTKFISKETDPAPVRRQRAINKWLATERNNEATNDRLLTTHDDYNILSRVSWSSFVRKAQELVVDIIGETVPFDALCGAFSGGASTSRGRTESHPASKYLGNADITSAARHWFELIFDDLHGWNVFGDLLSIREVPGNVLFTVPKNTTIDRCACKEPDLNMFLQKGVGNFIRSSLRKKGIDLNNQEINKNLARIGSLTGDLATLDLSSASDSISCSLVELLLPEFWFSCLNGLRSPITVIDGEEHVNEMFSSMGNGFTFELESLLFYVIARTTAYFEGIPGVISVYGDDIICPSKLAPDLTRVLNYFGFEINVLKSFWEGPFRESCGGHFYNGYDITPFYLKAPIIKLTDVIHIANAIRRWSSRGDMGILDPTLEALWLHLKTLIPDSLWGGYELGSITQLVSTDFPRKRLEARKSNKAIDSNGAYVHWLNTTWVRDTPGDAVEVSRMSIIGTKYRLRPISGNGSSYRKVKDLFLTEI